MMDCACGMTATSALARAAQTSARAKAPLRATLRLFRRNDAFLQNDIAVKAPFAGHDNREALARAFVELVALQLVQLEIRPLVLGEQRAEFIEDRLLLGRFADHFHPHAGVRNE